MKKKNTKKLILQNKKAEIKKTTLDEAYEFNAGDIVKDVGTALRVAKNSLKRAFEIGPVYFLRIIHAVATGKSIREVNTEVMQKQRQLSSMNKNLIKQMSGAKDLNAMLTIINPAVGSLSKGMEYSPDISEGLEKLSTRGRKSWNLFYRESKYLATGEYPDANSPFYLDDGSNRSDESQYSKINFVDSMTFLCRTFGKVNIKRIGRNQRSNQTTLINKTLTQINGVIKEKSFRKRLSKFLENEEFTRWLKDKEKIRFFMSLLKPDERPERFKSIEYFENADLIFRNYESNEKIDTITSAVRNLEDYLNKTGIKIESLTKNKKILFEKQNIILEEEEKDNSNILNSILAKIPERINDQGSVILHVINLKNVYINFKTAMISPHLNFLLYQKINNAVENNSKLTESDFSSLKNEIDFKSLLDMNNKLQGYVDSIKTELFVANKKNILDLKELKTILENTDNIISKSEKQTDTAINNMIKEVKNEETNTLTVAQNFIESVKSNNISKSIDELKTVLSKELKSCIENSKKSDEGIDLLSKKIEEEDNKRFHVNSGNYNLVSSTVINNINNEISKIEEAFQDIASKDILLMCNELESKVKEKLKEIEEDKDDVSSEDKSTDTETTTVEDEDTESEVDKEEKSTN